MSELSNNSGAIKSDIKIRERKENSKRVYENYTPYCLRCAKNHTGHATGICIPCRTVKCNCGKRFTMHVNSLRCPECDKSTYELNRKIRKI